MNKERHAYTIMVVPEREGREAFSFRISRRRVIFLSICAAVAVISMGVLIFKSVEAARKLSYFYALSRENDDLKKQNSRLLLIHEKISRMDTLAKYIEGLATLRSAKTTSAGFPEVSAERNTVTLTQTTSGQMESGMREAGPGENAQPLPEGSGPNRLPLDGWITQAFVVEEARGKTKHLGVDIAAAEGTIIKAPSAGVVTSVVNDRYYGILLVIKHDNGYSTRYGHCEKALVSQGERIERGQDIAMVGNTGRSTAPHLHYEVLKNGKNINPMDLLTSEKK